MSVLVVGEQQNGRINPASLECIVAAQQIGAPVTVVVPGADTAGLVKSLSDVEVAEVVGLDDPSLSVYTADGFLAALTGFLAGMSPTWVVSAHTYQARDFMPALAARLDCTLITDCTAVKEEHGGLVLTRPLFRGKVNADVVAEGPAPHFATFQIGAFRSEALRRGGTPQLRHLAAGVDAASIRQHPEAPFRETKQAVDLSQAERIVAVGRGIKDRDHVRLAEDLAAALGAEIAASRPICDAGWLPMDRQIGSSGQTVTPRLYVALGISGAIQHLVGMKGARTIVAINKDPEAPIFEVADYGIVGDLFDVVPALVEAVKAAKS